jgi:transcription-repair coupling factor (superfamily II helicase)
MDASTVAQHAPDADSLARAQAGLAALLSGVGAPRATGVATPRFGVLGLKGSAIAFVAALIARRDRRRPLLLLTATQKEAGRLAEDLAFFLGEPAEAGGLLPPPARRVRVFPSWDVLPFATLSPPSEIIHDRVEALARLAEAATGGPSRPHLSAGHPTGAPVVVAPVKALLERTLPPAQLAARRRVFAVGEEVDRDEIAAALAAAGYSAVPIVEDVGDASLRGGILDLFPPGYRWPLRIEFLGDEIETVRPFDPRSQRSRGHLDGFEVLPVRELLGDEARRLEARRRLRERAERLGLGRDAWGQLAEAIGHGFHTPGIETYLPDFHPEGATLLDYLPAGTILVRVDPLGIDKERDDYWAEIRQGHEQARREGRPVPEAAALYVEPAALDRELKARGGVTVDRIELLEPAAAGADGAEAAPVVRLDTETNEGLRTALADVRSEAGLLAPLAERVKARRREGDQVVLVCHTKVQATRLAELLEPYGLRGRVEEGPFDLGGVTDGFTPAPPGLRILVGGLTSGFQFPALGLTTIAEEEIFGERRRRRPAAAEQRAAAFLSSLADLRTGDIVVHVDHGVGVYRGLVNLQLSGVRSDFLHLEYQGSDRLYLPVDRINLVQKHVVGEQDEEAAPRIDKLGGTAWERVKSRVKASIREMAKELLALYAQRQVVTAHAFAPPDQSYREFEAAFDYEETPDQQAAIDEVLADLPKTRPMDRLVCGDVGYGKTEVAIRAAFLVVNGGKQVAILVPTTVLAQQHLQTLTARFRRYPIRVESLSRFRSAKEQKQVIADLAVGTIDIVIGTHRLLQKDVRFRDLGLVVVDEEQRFGVAHKERLKQLRTQVHCLTMTATPIPRTLHMSLSGVRDLSIINTPPADRLAIRTYVTRFADDTIHEAIIRELKRGGQVFFVHNRVQSIDAMEAYLRKLVPEAAIAIAHGQMREHQLEKVMLGFLNHETNLLLCTTIIESGLDFPSANTILINRADRLGLAQLYQLRGRVGRSKARAYAYLLVPGEQILAPEARKRLEALQELSELGSGFRLAARDLEIRGAGSLLGTSQSGHIAAVGFDLYMQLLEEAVAELRGVPYEPELDPEVTLPVEAFLPADYVADENQRLLLYKRLAQAVDEEALGELREELADRFGPLPPAAGRLVEAMGLKLLLRRARATAYRATDREAVISFDGGSARVSPERIVTLVRTDPVRYRFTPDQRLVMKLSAGVPDAAISEGRALLRALL